MDAIILTGGASVGAHDISNYVVRLAARGPRPGHPVRRGQYPPRQTPGFGLSPAGTPVWSLPGNPVAVFVSLQIFVIPGIKKMQRQAPHPRTHHVVTTQALRTPKDLHYYMLATVDDNDRATPLPSNSHLAAKMAQATGLLHVPPNVDGVAAEGTVEYIAL